MEKNEKPACSLLGYPAHLQSNELTRTFYYVAKISLTLLMKMMVLFFISDVMWGASSKKNNKKKKPVKKITHQDKIDAIITGKGLKDKNNKSIRTIPPPKDAVERACSMKEELLEQIEQLGERLPPNTLDQLIDELGGPENVAEVGVF